MSAPIYYVGDFFAETELVVNSLDEKETNSRLRQHNLEDREINHLEDLI